MSLAVKVPEAEPMYVATWDMATCFIVPSSFTTMRSASANEPFEAKASLFAEPSRMLISVVVMFAPSNISNSASPITAEPIVKPAAVTAPLNAAAPAAPISISKAVIALLPSVPLIVKFLSAVLTVSTTSPAL